MIWIVRMRVSACARTGQTEHGKMYDGWRRGRTDGERVRRNEEAKGNAMRVDQQWPGRARLEWYNLNVTAREYRL